MALNWNDPRAFLALARRGTLSAAAAELKCGVATLSRQIMRFEHDLGVPLFSRHQTGYRLTDDGTALIPKAEALEAAAQALGSVEKSRVAGRVRVATAENFANHLFLPSLDTLLSANPDLTIEFVTDVATANLHRRDADLAIRMVRPDRGNVTVRKIGTLGYGLYASRSYGAERRGGPHGTDLSADRYIAWSERFSGLPQAIWLERAFSGREPAIITATLAAQVVAAKAGLGLVMIPHFLADKTDLCRIPVDPEIEQDIWLVVHADLAGSARIRVVADHLVSVVTRNTKLLSDGTC